MTIYFLHCIHIIEHNVNVSNTACCWNEWSCHLQSVYAVLRQKWAEAIIRNCCIRCRPITFCSEKQATNWFTTILSRISANQENNMYICLDSFFFLSFSNCRQFLSDDFCGWKLKCRWFYSASRSEKRINEFIKWQVPDGQRSDETWTHSVSVARGRFYSEESGMSHV